MSKASAIFICLEVIIMVTPQIFPNLPHILAEIMFWGGVGGLIITSGLWILERYGLKVVNPFQKTIKDKARISSFYDIILTIVAKYNQITADYVYNSNYPKVRTQENQNELNNDFSNLLAIKEIMLDNKLESYLKDIRQRIAIIFSFAMSVEHDENELKKKRMYGAISNHEYNQEMPELHNDFLEYKKIIINYLHNDNT